jgi:prevent-host-death family protein
LREANQKFSKAMQIVKSGRNVVLTERGKPIAVLSPLPKLESEDAAIERLRSEGILQAAQDSRPMGPWKPIRARGRTSAELLRDERNAR